MDHDVLMDRLTRLKLTCIRDQLDSLLDEAAEKQLTLREAVAFLVDREVARKDERRLEMALKIAHFPAVRELANFDFKAQPSVDKRQIRELATSRWVAHGDAALLLGPPGVGKSHLAIALGREAIRQGYSVLFAPNCRHRESVVPKRKPEAIAAPRELLDAIAVGLGAAGAPVRGRKGLRAYSNKKMSL